MQKNAKTQKEQVVDVREASSFVGGVEETPPGKKMKRVIYQGICVHTVKKFLYRVIVYVSIFI